MNALLFILRKTLKNTLLDMLRHPLKLIMYVLVIAAIASSGVINMLNLSEREVSDILDIRLLHGIYLGVLLLISIPVLLSGLRSGGAMFTMSDVNMLFVSPISPKTILLYGLARQLGSTLLVCFFLLAYGGMAVDAFAISIPAALSLLLGVGLTVCLMQIVTMLIYSFVNGNPTRIRAVKYTLFALLLAVAAWIGYSIYTGGLSMESVCAAVGQPALNWIPFVGWMKGMLFGFMAGNWLQALVFMGLLLLSAGLAILLFLRSDADYYEDVLQNAETTYELKKAAQEGRASFSGTRTIKVRDTGLRGGWGASAFFYKHLREGKRRSRFGLISGTTLALVAEGLIMGLMLTRSSDEPASANIGMMVAVMMGVYLQFFFSAAGDWGQELQKPYLYLVPVAPLKKILWASMTSLLKPALDATIAFTILAIVIKASPLTAIICILLYTSFGAVFTSSNLLSQRVLGQMANKGLILVLYMLLLLLLIAPGVIAGVVLAVLEADFPKALAGLPVIVWNVAVSLGVYALCRNTLHDMEAM